MANSGDFNTNKYSTQYNGTIGLNLSWSITSQSTADNTSTIHWVLKSNGTMSSGYYVKGGPITVTIGGVTVLSITSRINVNGSGGFTRNGNITITHDENGDKSVSMSVRAALYSSAVNCTGSKTYALDHIDRYAIITSATDFTDEGNPTVVYANPAGGDVTNRLHVGLEWTDPAYANRQMYGYDSLSSDGGIHTFNIPEVERERLRHACVYSNTLTVTVILFSTMNGTEYEDTKDITMTIVNANPTVNNIYYSATGTSSITGSDQIVVQDQSNLRISTSGATAYKQASIVSYSLNFNGVDTDITWDKYLNIIKPSYSGTYTATITATDSRGNTGSITTDITITPWSQPTALCTLARVNGFETNTVLTVNGTISPVQGNVMSITERHRQVNQSTWSSEVVVTNNTPTILSLDNTKEWEVKVSVWDSFTDSYHGGPFAVYILTVGKGIPIMFIDTDMSSVGVHGFPDDDNQLYVGGDIKATGDLDLAGHLSLEGLKVRLHSVGPRTVNVTTSDYGIYYAEFTEDITSLGFNNVYYVFGSCGRTQGTNMSTISIESFSATAINYAIYRQSSMSLADHMTMFLIIGN